MIRTIRNLFSKDKPDYLPAYDLFIFEHLKNLLQSSSRAKNVGGIKLISELFEAGEDSLIVENCAELIHLCFGILNKLPGRFCYEIQGKTKELAWGLVVRFVKRGKGDGVGVAGEYKSLRGLMTKLLPLVFNVNIHLQKLSIELFNDLKNFIGEKRFCNILLGYEGDSEYKRLISISELMAQCGPSSKNQFVDGWAVKHSDILGAERPGTLLGYLFVYIFETLDSFKRTYECKTKVYGGLWSHHQLCQLASLVMLLTFIFKLKINLKLISDNGGHFEVKVSRIVSDLLLILQQNEEFNEKYMEFKGSAVRTNVMPNQNPEGTQGQHGQPPGQAQPAQPQPGQTTQAQPNGNNNPNAMSREPLPSQPSTNGNTTTNAPGDGNDRVLQEVQPQADTQANATAQNGANTPAVGTNGQPNTARPQPGPNGAGTAQNSGPQANPTAPTPATTAPNGNTTTANPQAGGTSSSGATHYPNLYQVNKNIHYIDIELDIHVDDYDFYIRAWSQLVEVTVTFFAQFLTKSVVYKAAKERHNLMRHSNIEREKDDLLELRDQIISKFFDLLPRVEKIIRESVYKAFKVFLAVETQIKEIMQEEKLIHSFRP
jgi:hypothetical protein